MIPLTVNLGKLGAWMGVALLVGVVPVRGETIYVWRDSTGVSHYTTDPEAVPVEYRDSAIPMVPEEAQPADDGDAPPASVVSTTGGGQGDVAARPGRSPEPVARDGTPPRSLSPEDEPPSADEARSLLERQRRARRSAWEAD